MKGLFATVLLLAFCATGAMSKGNVRVIRADSAIVDIMVDGKMFPRAWRISPEARPDVYKTSGKSVTFHTNRESVTVTVDRTKPVDFVIMFGGDSAFTRVQYEPSRLDMLKKAVAYNLNDNREIPAFTYQSAGDAALQALRKRFNLDSVAGSGTDASKIINILYWVHGAVRHDGGSDNPRSQNARDLIDTCRTLNRGVNCRMMGTIFRECCLSVGIPSRAITCMPREEKFDDCHVINIAWCEDDQKWIWADPTWCAYVMDERGELLGPAEVRERLIADRPLIINPDANWNREMNQTVEAYLRQYMAKNLYRISCPADSRYDCETYAEGKTPPSYVELLPLDGLAQEPQKETTQWGATFYKTNNPGAFWAKPQTK